MPTSGNSMSWSMVVTIKGKKYWLWRAVDANGYVLDALLQSRRNKAAALRLMRKLLKGQGTTPRVMGTDKLRSYSAAKAELMPGIEHRLHQQPRRKFTSSRTTTRTADDALQVGPAMPAFRLDTGPDRQSLPSSPQTSHRRRSSKASLPRHRNMAADHHVNQRVKAGTMPDARPVPA